MTSVENSRPDPDIFVQCRCYCKCEEWSFRPLENRPIDADDRLLKSKRFLRVDLESIVILNDNSEIKT